MWQDG
ncbi:hypothetical protein F383_01935 [Gossypium arboreum]